MSDIENYSNPPIPTPGSIGAQPLDATLTSLAAYNTNGLVTQTSADTFTGRTITGTANEIAITNGDGVSGNPTVGLASGIFADQTAMETGTSTTTIVSPGTVRYSPFAVKAWAYADIDGNILAGAGFSSVTDNGTGDITFNPTALSTTNYCHIIQGKKATSLTAATTYITQSVEATYGANSFRAQFVDSLTFSLTDPVAWSCIVLGDV